MEVTLAGRQFYEVRLITAGDDRYTPWWPHAEQINRSESAVILPAIAWYHAAGVLAQRIFNERGQRRGDVSQPAWRALARISRQLALRIGAPALKGLGVPGISLDIIPAWRISPKHYEPFPGDGEFVVLYPWWERRGGLDVTYWRETRAGMFPLSNQESHELYDEAAHLQWTRPITEPASSLPGR
jgi:hypothetical protein